MTLNRHAAKATHIICVKVPVKIESLANKREHWTATAKRKKAQRECALLALTVANRGRTFDAPMHQEALPMTITLTRIGPRQLDDDNLAGGFKHVRDGVADWLGIDDGDKRLTWKYEQRKGAPKEYAAEIRIESALEATLGNPLPV
jgi:hypothetical protein